MQVDEETRQIFEVFFPTADEDGNTPPPTKLSDRSILVGHSGSTSGHSNSVFQTSFHLKLAHTIAQLIALRKTLCDPLR